VKSPSNKEDLSTVLVHLEAGERLQVEALTLWSIFGKGAAPEARLDRDTLVRTVQFATEHNCDFDYDGSRSFGVFVKMPPVGSRRG
jgi:hypothetical protein